jgi:hypothetical protein
MDMDVEELESRFRQIDELAKKSSVDVRVGGDAESSGGLNIVVKEKRDPSAPARGASPSTGDKTASVSSATKTLLDIDLNDVEVPDEYIDARIRAAVANNNSSLPGAVLRQIGATRNWELVQPYTCTVALGGGIKFSITAVVPFTYDRASIPRFFWPLIDRDSLSSVPPLFHDLLYKKGGVLPTEQVTPYRTFTRKDADDVFLELMKMSGVAEWRYNAAYQAVRKFALFAWKG